MSLSSTALKQREKEAKALRSLFIYSLFGSVVLHIVVLALCLSNFLMKFPKVKDEPIEVTLIEVPNQEVKKLPEIQKSQSKLNAGGSSSDGRGGDKSGQQQTDTRADTSSISVVKQQTVKLSQQLLPKKIEPIKSPIQKFTDKLKTSPQQPTTPTETSNQVVTKPTIANQPSLLPNNSINKLVERLNTPPQQPTTLTEPSKPVTNTIQTVPSVSASQSNGTERSLTSSQPTGSRTIKGVGNGSGNGFGNGSGNSYGNGSGNGYGNGSGNGIGNGYGNSSGNGSGNGIGNQPKKENTTVATPPKPPADNNSRLARADCLKCEIKYPDRARRRGVEGNPEIAVDTDDNGNVTRVQLIRSSGDRELDEAAQRAAQEWKLKPTSGGRQSVRASVNFAMKGSQRHRELQERQRKTQTEAAQKKPQTTTVVPTPTETPKSRQRSTAGVVIDIPLENLTRRSRESPPSPEATPHRRVESDKTNPSQQTTPRRLQRTESNTPTQSQESKSEGIQRRRRRLKNILRRPQTSDSQEGSPQKVQRGRRRLEEILRRSQPAESPTTDAPAPSSKTPADSTNNN
jgi:TonB family protein